MTGNSCPCRHSWVRFMAYRSTSLFGPLLGPQYNTYLYTLLSLFVWQCLCIYIAHADGLRLIYRVLLVWWISCSNAHVPQQSSSSSDLGTFPLHRLVVWLDSKDICCCSTSSSSYDFEGRLPTDLSSFIGWKVVLPFLYHYHTLISKLEPSGYFC